MKNNALEINIVVEDEVETYQITYISNNGVQIMYSNDCLENIRRKVKKEKNKNKVIISKIIKEF
jgi:fibronectin type 3 domain-containing protein